MLMVRIRYPVHKIIKMENIVEKLIGSLENENNLLREKILSLEKENSELKKSNEILKKEKKRLESELSFKEIVKEDTIPPTFPLPKIPSYPRYPDHPGLIPGYPPRYPDIWCTW